MYSLSPLSSWADLWKGHHFLCQAMDTWKLGITNIKFNGLYCKLCVNLPLFSNRTFSLFCASMWNETSCPADVLTDSHLSLILDQLKHHASYWREIGIYLGFSPGELDVIQGRPLLFTRAPKSWLEAMLVDWLQWCPGDARRSTQYATLSALKKAVDKAGFGRTASELEIVGA